MPTKKASKKGGFTLAPILLSQPVPDTDGFSNLVDDKPATETATVAATKTAPAEQPKVVAATKPKRTKPAAATKPKAVKKEAAPVEQRTEPDYRLDVDELLKILEADSLDDIYELTDVLRASSLKLYATLVTVSDDRGRARIKNHELMQKAGIKGIATLYKQERWLSSLRLVEKKAKPGPHDGSSYVVYKLETLPLPDEILQKFAQFMTPE